VTIRALSDSRRCREPPPPGQFPNDPFAVRRDREKDRVTYAQSLAGRTVRVSGWRASEWSRLAPGWTPTQRTVGLRLSLRARLALHVRVSSLDD
jgi:hypothetical protein